MLGSGEGPFCQMKPPDQQMELLETNGTAELHLTELQEPHLPSFLHVFVFDLILFFLSV